MNTVLLAVGTDLIENKHGSYNHQLHAVEKALKALTTEQMKLKALDDAESRVNTCNKEKRTAEENIKSAEFALNTLKNQHKQDY